MPWRFTISLRRRTRLLGKAPPETRIGPRQLAVLAFEMVVDPMLGRSCERAVEVARGGNRGSASAAPAARRAAQDRRHARPPAAALRIGRGSAASRAPVH